MRGDSFKKAAAVLAAAGLILSVAGVLIVSLTTFPGVSIERVHFETAPYDSPPEKVSGLLLWPDEPVAEPTPAVVFSHGLGASRELYLEPCRELAMKGVVVLAIDLRGHGGTGGANDAGFSERKDVWAAVDFLREKEGVDADRIAVGGHSLGAITSTTAGIFQKGDGIKTVVAIAGQPGRKEAAELMAGSVEEFLGKIWPFLAWSRRFDITDDEDLQERQVIDYMDESRPPNYQLIVGEKDSLLPVETAERMMEKATGLDSVEVGKTYGDFRDGTARRLVVTGDTHMSEAFGEEVWYAFTEWVFESFGLDFDGRVGNRALLRYLGQALVILGFFLIALAALYVARFLVEGRAGLRRTNPYDPGGRGRGLLLAAVSSALFAAVSLAAFPFAELTGMRAFVPFLGADVYTSLAASRTVLLIPATLVVLVVIRYGGMNRLRPWSSGGDGVRVIGKSVLVGVLPFSVFMLLYAPTAHGLYLTRGVPVSAGGYFTLLAVVLVQLVAEQEFFHYFLLPAFGPRDTRAKRMTYVISESLLRGFTFGLAFLAVVPGPFFSLGRQSGFPFVLAMMIAGFLLFLPVSALSLYARRRGYSVLAPCLAYALFIAVLFGGFLSVTAW